MSKVTTYLTFKEGAEEAVKLYTSVIKNSRILSIHRSDKDQGPITKGQVLNVSFELDGQPYMAMDGGEDFTFTYGVSLHVSCETQKEIDELWAKLTAGGGEPGPCGWLKDRFGLSWQIVPRVLGEMMTDTESGNSDRVVEEMLKMGKLDIKTLKDAYAEPREVSAEATR